jgi:hypothetical protein
MDFWTMSHLIHTVTRVVARKKVVYITYNPYIYILFVRPLIVVVTAEASSDCWVDLNPGLSHIESGSPSCDSIGALIGGAPHFHG